MANTIEKQDGMGTGNTEHGDPDTSHPDQKKRQSHPVRNFIVIVAVLAVLLIVGILPRIRTSSDNNAAAKTAGKNELRVQTIHAKPAPPTAILDLPGNIEALKQTSVNARATGYLKQWLVDIGDHVTQGQVLATIETPDMDQELLQARSQMAASQAAESQAQAGLIGMVGNLDQAKANQAKAAASLAQAVQQVAQQKSDVAQAQQAVAQQQADLVQAEATRDLAKITAQRYQNLVNEKAIAQQTADQEEVAYKTAEANVQALQASVGASKANVAAIQSGVSAAQSNVVAYRDALLAAKSSVDTAVADVSSSRANVVAARANTASSQENLARTQVLTQFQNVTAPFSGVITARNVDNGALISAGGTSGTTQAAGSTTAGTTTSGGAASGGTSAGSGSTGGASSGSLFSIAQLDRLRIYINVPQEDVGSVHAGVPATVFVKELPSRKFSGTIVRTADALDPSSRTLVAEVDLNNQGDLLKPGMFADVKFQVQQPAGTLLIPDSAMISSGQGTQVATVSKDKTVHLVNVTVGRDFGQVMQILDGITSKDTIIDNPPDGIREGEKATATPEKVKKQAS
jgi:multidrug efflux pump subunit AcrA (membrane-fusion protein)